MEQINFAMESAALESAEFGSYRWSNRKSYMQVNADGIAKIEIMGPLMRRVGKFESWLYGATDTQVIVQDLKEAKERPNIRAVLLHVDSPGGQFEGTAEVADAIRSLGKPSIAYTDGMMASAAYWIGSAADKVFASKDSSVGSIGVVAMHVDRSKLDEKNGIKRTFITAGKFKRIAGDNETLSEDGKAYLQEMVDDAYSMFVADVAKNRNISDQSIRDTEARVYMAEKALEIGLIDGIVNIESAIKKLKRRAGIMDLSELKKDFPALWQEVNDEAFQAGVKDGIAKGAENERKRIAEIQAEAFKGQDDLVQKLISDGVGIDEARKQIIADQKARGAKQLESIAKSDPGDIGQNADSTIHRLSASSLSDAGDKLDLIAKQIKTTANCSYSEAFERALKENPNLSKIYNGRG